MTLLDKEPVRRVEKSLKEFNSNQSVIILDTSARTAEEAASSLSCEVGAIVKSLLFKAGDIFVLCLVFLLFEQDLDHIFFQFHSI